MRRVGGGRENKISFCDDVRFCPDTWNFHDYHQMPTPYVRDAETREQHEQESWFSGCGEKPENPQGSNTSQNTSIPRVQAPSETRAYSITPNTWDPGVE